MPKITIEYDSNNKIEVEVSMAVAAFLKENDSYMKRLEHIDERHFRLLRFTARSWENMKKLAADYSVEDDYLNITDEIAAAEWADYQRRLDLCRDMLCELREACTPTQWRRYELHKAFGHTTREIAVMENCRHVSVVESIRGVEKKLKKIFAKHL